MARATDEVTIPAGKVLCEQGTIAREAYVIVQGTGEVRINKKQVAAIGPGTCVGELALLDHQPRTASVVASSDMTVLVIGVREFGALLDEVPSITHKLMKSLASKIRELDSRVYG